LNSLEETRGQRHAAWPWWIPTAVWLVIQASFSTDTFSAEHTGGVLLLILHALFGNISAEHLAELNFFIRKSAHFCSYGTMGVLAFFSWRATLPAPSRWLPRWTALALALVLVAASLDEFHQSFVPSRTASWHDVVLDVIGASAFQAVLAWYLRRKHRPAKA
jgi:VanZ family protein